MRPQLDQLQPGFDRDRVRDEDALEDLEDVAHVKYVVRLHRHGHEVLADAVLGVDGGLHDLVHVVRHERGLS